MTASPQASDPRLEPLLWLQLLGVGAIPAEGLALLLLLGSVDPGPLPGLERLLIWALGVLAPAMVMWQRPADCWSLLLVQAPLRGRRDLQRRLSRLQAGPAPRVALVAGAALLLPSIWIVDQAGGLATGFSPLTGTSRLVVLLLSIPLLAVILWQWQQLWQAIWLLSRPVEAIRQAAPLSAEELDQSRLSIGLPVLLIDPLQASPGADSPRGLKTPKPSASAAGAGPTAGSGTAQAATAAADPEAATPEAVATAAAAAPEAEDPSEELAGLATSGAAVEDSTPEASGQPEAASPSSENPESNLDPSAEPEQHQEALEEPETSSEDAPVTLEGLEPIDQAEPNPESSEDPEASEDREATAEASAPVAIKPEEATGNAEGGHLDQQVVDLDP